MSRREAAKALLAYSSTYDHFNQALFDDCLPPCIITMIKKAKTLGYFAGGR